MAPSTVTETLVVQGQNEQSKQKELPTVDEFRRAIPPECFERSLGRSVAYLIWDFAVLAGLYAVVDVFEGFGFGGLLLWYWIMGMFGSSLFCIGHDCGHGTFSEWPWVNAVFGHIAHAPILAPFWPWAKSHRQHHQFTSHIDKDMGHPWVTQENHSSRNWFTRNFSRIPISALFRWNPVYTLIGQPDGSHFWPFSSLFTNNWERMQCVISGSLCAVCFGTALHLSDYSIYNFVKYYYIPVLFQGYWLVMITYLQHQDEEIEVYESGNWHYVKGQMQTIDREYGFGIDSLLHHITDGHVAHHLFFTRIPHYHLPKATEAIRTVLSKYPGAYKRRRNFDFLLEFIRLNLKLEYLIGTGTGLLKYRRAAGDQKKCE